MIAVSDVNCIRIELYVKIFAGYTDATCSTDLNECRSSPCRNGGLCIDEVGRFRCFCPAGFSDPVCGTNIDECASNPCRNGGTCIDSIDSYQCRCKTGY